MNTLLLSALFAAVALDRSVDAFRKWPLASRPRALPAMWMAYYVVMLVISAGVFLYLISHPSDIQPLTAAFPEWMAWAYTVFGALFLLIILVRLGEIARNLLHRFARQHTTF